MPPAGRVGDLSLVPIDSHGCPSCPHVCIGPAIQGSGNVHINGRPALRAGDHGLHAACCGTNLWSASVGSKTVIINGKNAHRMTDIDSHCGHNAYGLLVTGSSDVIIGGPPDLKGFAIGLVGGAIGGAIAGQLGNVINGVEAEVAARFGPIVGNAVAQALGGAVSGAVAGAFSAAVMGGNILSGALGGAEGGALNGALAGAVAGFHQELASPPPQREGPLFNSADNHDPLVFLAGINNPDASDCDSYVDQGMRLYGDPANNISCLVNGQNAFHASEVFPAQSSAFYDQVMAAYNSGQKLQVATFSNGVNGLATALNYLSITAPYAVDQTIDSIVVIAPAANNMSTLNIIADTGKPMTVLYAPSDLALQIGQLVGVDRGAVSDFTTTAHSQYGNVTGIVLDGPVAHSVPSYLDAFAQGRGHTYRGP